MAEVTQAEIAQAVKAKKIDRPVMKATKRGKTITLHLYGGEVVKVPSAALK